MSYQLNSAKDARGDEHLFMAKFNQARGAIEAYRQQHGGDLEHAFQAVTGIPWPAGRSVKISHGVPEMTKDRTFKSVLGKYVAPIGAGALTALTFGGAAPSIGALFGLGGGGATAGGTVAGSTVPGLTVGGTSAAGGSIGGLMGGLGGVGKFLTTNAGMNALNQGVGAVTNLVGASRQAGAMDRAAQLEAQAQAASLDFLKQQEATRKQEYDEAQRKNFQMYQDREARLAPYRRLGAGSIGQMMQAPMPMNGVR